MRYTEGVYSVMCKLALYGKLKGGAKAYILWHHILDFAFLLLQYAPPVFSVRGPFFGESIDDRSNKLFP